MAEFDFSDAVNPFAGQEKEFDFSDAVNPFVETSVPPKERTWGEAASDTGAAVMGGFASLGGSLVHLGDTVTGGVFDIGAREAFEDAGKFWEEAKSDSLKQQKKEVHDADGFFATAGAMVERPATIADLLAGSLPHLLPVGAAARLGKGITVARGMKAGPLTAEATAALSKKAAGAAATTGMVTGGVLEGADAGSQAYNDAMEIAKDKTPEELISVMPVYKKLVGEGMSHEDAVAAIAYRSGLTAQMISTPISIIASKLTGAGKLEADLFTGAGVKGWKNGLLGVGREGLEETIQEGGNRFAQNVGVNAFADPTREYGDDVADSAAMGMVAGVAQGGGIQGINAITGRAPTQQAPQNDDESLDQPANGEGLIDELQPNTQPAEPLQLNHNPERMVVMPDGTTAWESELSALGEQSAVTQHPAYARIQETPEQVESSLAEPISVDDEINSMLAELTDYRAERVSQTVQPAMQKVFDEQGEVNPFAQFDDGEPSGLFDGVKQYKDDQAFFENEYAAQEQQKLAAQEAERTALQGANFQEDDERGFMGEVKRLSEQSQFEPIKNQLNPADLQEIYPADPRVNEPTGKAEPRLPADNLPDSRLARPEYRTRLESLANELTKGGGIGYVRDKNDVITGRTPSLNADWFKAMNENPDTSMSVENAQAAIQKALKGQKLGVRQMRVVGAALDAVSGERGSYARDILSARSRARADRQAAFDNWLKETNVPEDADFVDSILNNKPAETFAENDYLPHMDMESRAVSELADHAESSGASWEDIGAALEMPDIFSQTKALTTLIGSLRNEHRETAGKPAGNSEGAGSTARASAPSEPRARSGTAGSVEEEAANASQVAKDPNDNELEPNISQVEPKQEAKQPRPSDGVLLSNEQENAKKTDNQQNIVDSAISPPSSEQSNTALVKAIPPSILKNLKVDYDMYDENTESYSTQKVPARDALNSVNEDIETYNSLLKCVRGG